ncbi:MAG: hypothetical protein IJ711_00080 [Lachnospiraceae bacterium]|nr:hypothetical protein [Clostridia bacterium]MBR1691152.1 hypothetical protein [Lachnospiraceae bacterium]
MLNNVSIMENQTPIHVFSTTNEWIDCVFIVKSENAEKAREILENAFDAWFETDTSEPYGDWLCRAMNVANLDYDVFYNEEGLE